MDKNSQVSLVSWLYGQSPLIKESREEGHRLVVSLCEIPLGNPMTLLRGVLQECAILH